MYLITEFFKVSSNMSISGVNNNDKIKNSLLLETSCFFAAATAFAFK